ncbi:hypothetical protein C8J57DRAFT_1526050 [Mycena rebaudengoi]|nr:hypothetical protein C8J57DRAFT_1526050 [Mycena rebaudengoi]
MRSHRSVSRYTSLAVKSESGLNTTRLPRPKHSINTRRKNCGQQTSTVFHHHLQYSSYAMHFLKSLAMTVFPATPALAQSIVVDAPRPGANILTSAGNAPPAHPGLRKCAICVAGCYAAQHAEMVQSEPAPAPKSVPRPQPPSATLNSMHTARGFAAPAPGPSTASPFRVHVKRRQEDIETNRKQNSTPGYPFQSKKFHPAERSQINGDLNPYDSRKHKAKAQSPTVGDPQNAMHVPLDNIALQLDSSSSLRQSLEDAFESATDAGNMKHAVVVGGEYGLRRFYAVVIEQLLDTIDRTDYEDVFKQLNDTSRALARKCANYVKSKPGPGAKPKPSPVPEDENGPRTRAQTAGASAPRNSKSGHFKTPREPNEQFSIAAALDMTGTESATEFWYRNLRPGPGIKTRRNRRHTTEYVASSENEDYMPKPPPKPKGCWVDVNISPSLSPPPAPPSSEEQHNLDLEDAEDLMTLEWFGLRHRILKRLPHPNPQKRDTLKDLNQLNHTQQFRQLSKANQNVTQSARWQEVTTKIMTAINDKRR